MATPARPEISVRVVPGHLKNAPSRKGKRLTRAQLASKKPRVELTLKQKCGVTLMRQIADLKEEKIMMNCDCETSSLLPQRLLIVIIACSLVLVTITW